MLPRLLPNMSIVQFLLVISLALVTGIGATTSSLYYHIPEESHSNSLIGIVSQDSNLNATRTRLTYTLLREGYPHSKLFWINTTSSELRTSTVLNREGLCPDTDQICVLEILVGALSTPDDFFQIIPIYVTVDDVNDHKPVFPQSGITLLIPESTSIGSRFKIPSAVDNDFVKNRIQRYSIRPESQEFKLQYQRNFHSGFDLWLVVNSVLDREWHSEYNFWVTAYDGGLPTKTGNIKVKVLIIDTNDHKPIFSQNEYMVTIPEDTRVGKSIVNVLATDKDIGHNGLVMYRFSPQTAADVKQAIHLDNQTGEITLAKPLDYESKTSYQLVVEATDQGVQHQTSQAAVIINVADVNDNKPIIHFNLLSDIPETIKAGGFVAHVTVSDADTGLNGKISCDLVSDHLDLLPMFGNEFKLTMHTAVDREITSEVAASITCSDNGSPPLRSNTIFRVDIRDVNEYTPTFRQSTYRVFITENNLPNTLVIQVIAEDGDADLGDVSYQLDQGGRDDFSIDSKTGTIVARKPLDREDIQEHVLLVVAKDNGTPPLSATTRVIVTVKDLNDVIPTFDKTAYELQIPEHSPVNTIIGDVTALDSDLGESGRVIYSILPNSVAVFDHVPFSIHSVFGTLKSNNVFDRETIDEYRFIVVAIDHGVTPLSSSVSVIVKVTDLNDHDPKIDFPNSFNNSVSVAHISPADLHITTVQAHDLDDGKNSRLSFTVAQGNDIGMFRLDENTGDVLVNRQLLLTDAGRYKLVLAVSDGGIPPRVSYETLNIDVIIQNTTALSSSELDGNLPTSTIIIVVLSVTTVVFAFVITCTLIILKKKSRKRPQHFVKPEAEKMVTHPDDSLQQPRRPLSSCFTQINDSCSTDTTLWSMNNSTTGFLAQDRTNQKLSLPNLSFAQSSDVSRGMSKAPSIVSAIDQQALQHPQACSSMVTQNSVSSHNSQQANPAHTPPAAASPRQYDLSPGETAFPLDIKHMLDMIQRLETNSDSSGDFTSDSGRGPSDEENPRTSQAVGQTSHTGKIYPRKTVRQLKRSKTRPQIIPSDPVDDKVETWMSGQELCNVPYMDEEKGGRHNSDNHHETDTYVNINQLRSPDYRAREAYQPSSGYQYNANYDSAQSNSAQIRNILPNQRPHQLPTTSPRNSHSFPTPPQYHHNQLYDVRSIESPQDVNINIGYARDFSSNRRRGNDVVVAGSDEESSESCSVNTVELMEEINQLIGSDCPV